MNTINLYINDPINAELDTDSKFNMAFNYSIADIKDISKKNGHWSKTITLPGTQNNNYWFGQLFDVQSDFTFMNPNKKTDCQVLVNTELIIDGFLQLKNIKKISKADLAHDEVYYECVIYSDTIDFFTDLGAKTVKELDFTEYRHTYSKVNIENSWTNDYTDAYVYPMYYNNNSTFETRDFYPAVFLRKVVDKIFEEAGYGWTGSLQYDERFNSEILPYIGDGTPKISDSEKERREFYVGVRPGASSIQLGTSSFSGNTYQSINYQFKDETTPYYDNDNHWSGTEWIVDTNGTFNIQSQISFTFNVENPTSSQIDRQTNILWGNQPYDPQVNLTCRLMLDNGGVNPVVWSTKLIPPFTPGATVSGNGTWKKDFTVVFPSQNSKNLNVSDRVYIEIVGEDQGTWTTYYYTDSNSDPVDCPISITPTRESNIYTNRKSYIRNIPLTGYLSDGDYVDLNEFLPDKLKQSDIISDLQKRYNLFIQPNPDNKRQLLLDPRPTFYEKGEVIDWTDKKDFDSEESIKFLSDLQNKKMLFTFKPDKDSFNEYYTEETGDIYGQLEYDFDNDFVKGEKKIESAFSPTPMGNIPLLTNELIVPAIDPDNPKGNPRVLLWGGLKKGLDGNDTPWTLTWIDPSGNTQVTHYTSYPYAGNWNDPYTPTLSNNWGQPKFLYYNGYNSLTANHLYNNYWKNYIYQIENGKMVTSKFNLKESDISYIKDNFNAKIFVKDSYYYVNSIKDYKPYSDELTTVELIKIVDGVTFEAESIINPDRPIKLPDVSNPVIWGGVDRPIKPSSPSISIGGKNDVSVGVASLVIGDGNLISFKDQGTDTEQLYSNYGRNLIVGNGNQVFTDKSGVIGGDDNVISGEKSFSIGGDNNNITAVNSVLIAASGMTASQDNTIYLGPYVSIDNLTGDMTTTGTIIGGNTFWEEGGIGNFRLIDESYNSININGESTTSMSFGNRDGSSLSRYLYIDSNSIDIFGDIGNRNLHINGDKFLAGVDADISSMVAELIMADNTLSNITSSLSYNNKAIIIGSKGSTFNQSVKNSVIVGGSGIVATSDNTLYASNLLVVNEIEADNLIINKLAIASTVEFSKPSTTNTLTTYTFDCRISNIIEFTATSDVVLSYTTPLVGTYVFIINCDGFDVSLDVTGDWQSVNGNQPIILGKTILTGIYDGSRMIVMEVNNVDDIL